MCIFSTRNIAGAVLCAGLSLCQPHFAQSYDLGPLKLHGFMSQGFILTSENNSYTPGSKSNGSFAFNELGLNGSYQLRESIVFSGQIGSRDLGDEGNNELYLDYLQADIQLRDWFGARIGRYKVPIGFYNQTRDIDLARATVFLPQSIYTEAYRPFVANATGGLVYGNVNRDNLGDISYEIFYGKAGEDKDSCLVQSLEIMLGGTDMDMDSKDIYGASIQYATPIDGLRFGFSIVAGESDFDYTDKATGLHSSFDGSMDSMSVVSAEYSVGDFTFVSEYMYSRQTNTLTIGSTALFEDVLTEPEGFYLGGSWRMTEQLETTLYWENYYRDNNDKHGNARQAVGLQDHQAWQKSWVAAIRYDICDWWLIKAETSIMDGTALISPHYNEPGTLSRHWNSFALKTTFYF